MSYPEGTTASMVLLCGRFPGHCNPTEEILSRILDPVHHSSRYSPEHLNRIEPNQISKRRLELASFTFYRWENRRLDFVDFKRQSSGSMSPIISVVQHHVAKCPRRVDHNILYRLMGFSGGSDARHRGYIQTYRSPDLSKCTTNPHYLENRGDNNIDNRATRGVDTMH